MPHPYVVSGTPQGLKNAVVVVNADHIQVNFSDNLPHNAYYLPWQNNNYTEAVLDLNQVDLRYFFTAEFSGCSLWARFDAATNTLTVRHESRIDQQTKAAHLNAGFSLILDSHLPGIDLQIDSNQEGEITDKRAEYYVVHAEVMRLPDNHVLGVNFVAQLVEKRTNYTTNQSHYAELSQFEHLLQ
ncbi:hypothetical protein [Dickeya dadantii]|uniref:hypothetical protein n=1 Tax=Dickeya dadantii TaxID=204038 RepID=UPI001C0CB8D6|nr:hypothetical protein [Dickeya dadantii]QWT40501.1 hypothetical protein KNV89_19610 [Dickeya dadantii]